VVGVEHDGFDDAAHMSSSAEDLARDSVLLRIEARRIRHDVQRTGRFSINAGTDRTHDYSGHRALTWATTTATIRRAGSSGRAEHVPRPRALRLTDNADHERAGRRAHPIDAR
jgi:hypothetical protein